MDIAELTDRIEYVSAGYADQFGIERTEEWILLKLTEELGELVQAQLTDVGQGRDRGLDAEEQSDRVAQELVDVFAMVLVLAKRRGIDIEKTLDAKWFRYEAFHRERGFVADA